MHELARRGSGTTADPTSGKTYAYSSENLLTSASGSVTLAYDPMLRLYQLTGAATTRFAYDGLAMIAEYNGAGALQRRFVHGPGADETIVWYEGAGTTDRRFLGADERGSIVSVSDGTGAMLNLNRYDEYGKPQGSNAGRFGYTGQMWLGEVGLNYYKARMYAPQLGRFLQPDPIGTGGGINLYAYVGNDPVNAADSSGLCNAISTAHDLKASNCYQPINPGEIVVTATKPFRFFTADILDTRTVGGEVFALNEASERREKQQNKTITCSTKLPNGKAIGDYVREARAELQGIFASDTGGEDQATLASGLGAFAGIVGPSGQIDFKNVFAGRASRELLGDAGNFAYYAIGQGYFSTTILDLGAGAYGLYGVAKGTFPSSFLTGRFYSNDSARRQRAPGLAAGGCQK